MTDITHANREARAQEALGIIYAHHVIKYDPNAAERVMTNALDTARVAALDEAIAVVRTDLDRRLSVALRCAGGLPRLIRAENGAATIRRIVAAEMIAALEALKGGA